MDGRFFFCCALVALISRPLLAAEAPVTGDLRLSSDIERPLTARQAFAQKWKLPSLKSDALVHVRAQVQPDGHLSGIEMEVDGPPSEQQSAVRQSAQAALANLQLPIAAGAVEFSLRARANARIPACFPLKVYVSDQMEDSSEAVPEVAIRAMHLGVTKWNAAISSFHKGSVMEPFILTSRPEEADVRIEAYQDYPDYSGYFIDEQTGRMIVRVPLKRFKPGLLQGNFQWWHPEQVLQQTMFQMGRALGLDLSDQPSNVLFAGQSLYIVTGPQRGVGLGSYDIRIAQFGDLVNDQGGGDRTLTNFQLEDAGELIKHRRCGAGLRAALPVILESALGEKDERRSRSAGSGL
ncbi:hypothetical protein [Gloeobacter kilaueensis]|uniref:Uncharacterized protein n=1 Tax=Gloeobacter kilaueensis (strain ATCC BAA-2537 / CCAP 1431/1 / ULC 316 / JS1) TaxID=1183438 RepID=U5QDT8_GLOK1|nr:hypothetical protein [Gloeobacter kilaueensis]AGY57081.1 hypothetical protein GKIL_0835 [Gloeobacter kilaueensis JS1]